MGNSCFRMKKKYKMPSVHAIIYASHAMRHIDDECPICLDLLQNKKKQCMTFCKHHYHYECLRAWCDKKKHCPICRQPIRMCFVQTIS